MYHVIEPIKLGPYKINRSDPTLETLNAFLQLDPEEDILRFIKYHPECLYLVITSLPIPKLLDLYQNSHFLRSHFDQELLNEVLIKSNWRFSTKKSQELIKLDDSIGTYYNFSAYFRKRLDLMCKTIEFDLNSYYLGTTVLALADKSNKSDILVELYPRTKTIKLPPITTYFRTDNYILTRIESYLIRIYIGHFASIEDLLTLIPIAYNGNIWCRFSSYQNLDSKPQPQEKLIITGQKLEYLKICNLIKYKVPKQNFSRCYICKAIYDPDITYERYSEMCLLCGQFNYQKRINTTNLSNLSLTAFVSGIRQKIGLQIALKLLRAGAKVIGTTRYPNATLFNYTRQPDYDNWKGNLTIYRCNFLNIVEVNTLIDFLREAKISIIINNAAQTIKASDHYYSKLANLENLIESNKTLTYLPDPLSTQELALIVPNNIVFNQFYDIQDIDIKEESSWNKRLEEVDTHEIFESVIINQTVPTLFVSGLKNHMISPKFIINVTALEGKFNTTKTPNHVHTNMCKAAMNMMTLTISQEPDINIYSINPGFVSGINPQAENNYPLSAEDGASRILDPIIEYYKGNPIPKDWIHLRNYKPDTW